MAVVFRSVTSAVNTSFGTGPVVTAPAGLADGDVIVIVFGTNDTLTAGGTPTLNGFTNLGIQNNGTVGGGHALWKVASGEGANWTFTGLWGGAGSIGDYACVAYQDDAAGDAALDQSAVSAPTSSTTPVSPSITPSVDNCMVLGCFAGDAAANTTATELGGATERSDANNASGTGKVYIEELLQTSAAPVTMSATFTGAVELAAYTLSIKPTAAAGRTTKNTRAFPLGVNVGMNWRSG